MPSCSYIPFYLPHHIFSLNLPCVNDDTSGKYMESPRVDKGRWPTKTMSQKHSRTEDHPYVKIKMPNNSAGQHISWTRKYYLIFSRWWTPMVCWLYTVIKRAKPVRPQLAYLVENGIDSLFSQHEHNSESNIDVRSFSIYMSELARLYFRNSLHMSKDFTSRPNE